MGNGKEKNRVATVSNDFLIMYDEDVLTFVTNEMSWVIDSGASVHATSRKDFFTSYAADDYGVVKMGNDGVSKVVGIGDVCLETNNGTRLVLKNVKHVPDIRLNLIFASKLDDDGFCNVFGNG